VYLEVGILRQDGRAQRYDEDEDNDIWFEIHDHPEVYNDADVKMKHKQKQHLKDVRIDEIKK